MTPRDPASLWAMLAAEGFVRGEMPAPSAARSPWYVRLMLGISGWIGALFLFGFLSDFFRLLMSSAPSAVAVGAALCAGAGLLLRMRPRDDFSGQLGLAVSIAGQILILKGLYDSLGQTIAPAALAMSAVQALLCVLVPNVVHRVWTAATGAFAAAWGLGGLTVPAAMPALVTAACSWLWLREFDIASKRALRTAAGHGLALAAMVAVVLPPKLWLEWESVAVDAPWVGAVGAAAVVLWVAASLLRREGIAIRSGAGLCALAGAAVLAAISLNAPGVGLGATLLLLGFANAHGALTGLGLLTLLAYVVRYYYMLDMTLLAKSAHLAGAGAALLVARLAMRRAWPAAVEARHA